MNQSPNAVNEPSVTQEKQSQWNKYIPGRKVYLQMAFVHSVNNVGLLFILVYFIYSYAYGYDVTSATCSWRIYLCCLDCNPVDAV